MIIIAKTTNATVTPRKLQLLAAAVKGMTPQAAVEQLSYLNKSASRPLLKVIKQALSNAKNNFALSETSLRFHSIEIGKGLTYHRGHPGPRGRFKPFDLMRSNITVKLFSASPAPLSGATTAPTTPAIATKATPKKTATKKASTSAVPPSGITKVTKKSK